MARRAGVWRGSTRPQKNRSKEPLAKPADKRTRTHDEAATKQKAHTSKQSKEEHYSPPPPPPPPGQKEVGKTHTSIRTWRQVGVWRVGAASPHERTLGTWYSEQSELAQAATPPPCPQSLWFYIYKQKARERPAKGLFQPDRRMISENIIDFSRSTKGRV
jgi:hypothetical protein